MARQKKDLNIAQQTAWVIMESIRNLASAKGALEEQAEGGDWQERWKRMMAHYYEKLRHDLPYGAVKVVEDNQIVNLTGLGGLLVDW